MKILGIVGSLRSQSYNKALLNAFFEMKPDGVTIDIADIGTLPLFNDDLMNDFPESAQKLKTQIEAADALIITTPEYNRSIPGVLKNAIDWATRPRGKNSFVGKRIFITGASNGILGTAVAQYDLRKILVHERAEVIGYPEMFVGLAESKFNEKMVLTDEPTREKIKEAWVRIIE